MPSQSLILGTAGHIDHGKTAIVQGLTSIDTDRLPQEKARGITIDIGFAYLPLNDGTTLGVIDVPGHEKFVRNMLAGASGIDLAMLIIAADDGIMPQTREHLAILELLDIAHGLIVLTKTDLAEEAWLELVEDDIRELVAGTFLENSPIIRTSALQGSGIDELKEILQGLASQATIADRRSVFRLPIDRAFVGTGVGTIVTGSVNSGRLSVDDEVELLPSGTTVRVRSLQSHGQQVQTIGRGQRAAINLIGIHHTKVSRGHELARPGYLKPSQMMSVRLHCWQGSPRPIKHRMRLRLHIGTQEIMAAVRLLDTREIQPGESALAQLILAEPGIAVGQQPFVVRAESPVVTLGGGKILQPVARKIRPNNDAKLAFLQQLTSADVEDRLAATIALHGTEGCSTLALARDACCREDEVQLLVEALLKSKQLISLDVSSNKSITLHPHTLEILQGRILVGLQRAHEKSPLLLSIPRQQVVARVARRDEPAILNAVAERMISSKLIVGDEQTLAHPEFRPQLSQVQQELLTQLRTTYRDAAFMPPDVRELSKTLGVADKEIRKILDLCVAAGDIAHLGGPLYMDADYETQMKERIRAALRQQPELAVKDIRDLLDTSRKYAVPLCEYLDRIGITKRVGDMRIAGDHSETTAEVNA